MANKKLEERISQLRRLSAGEAPPDVDEILRKGLADRSNLVIAAAAKSAGEMRRSECVPALLEALNKLFEDAVKTDPKCWGKTSITKALVQLDYSDSAPFVRGLRHIQMEPVVGGREDSAGHLRSNCALALVQCTDIPRFEIIRHLVDALADGNDSVRTEAVRALHQLAGDEAVLLLRFKARTGDASALIIGHVFDALLSLERDRAVPFVREFLSSVDNELRDEAALALGGSRLMSAVKVLQDCWKESHSQSFSQVLLRAISSSRVPEAIDFLIQLLKTGTPAQSAAALESLKLHEGSSEIQALIDEAKKQRVQ